MSVGSALYALALVTQENLAWERRNEVSGNVTQAEENCRNSHFRRGRHPHQNKDVSGVLVISFVGDN